MHYADQLVVSYACQYRYGQQAAAKYLDIDFQQLAQLAAEVQESIIRRYVDFVNTYSVYRSRLQSKTGADETNEEDFER